jgi:hypothetical protein
MNLYDFARVPIMGHIGKPSELDMELIRNQAPDELDPDELFVYSARASNGKHDSHHSWMADSSLRNYAEDYKEGRPFLLGHDDTQVMGRTYNGEFRDGETLISSYVIRGIKITDISSDDFIKAVRGGIRKDVSIRYSKGEQICDICDNQVLSRACSHLPGRDYEVSGTSKKATYGIHNARGAEVSSVWKASNANSVVLKAADLKARGMLTDRDIDEYNLKYSTNLRADMIRPDILSLAAINLQTDESYLQRAIKAYLKG